MKLLFSLFAMASAIGGVSADTSRVSSGSKLSVEEREISKSGTGKSLRHRVLSGGLQTKDLLFIEPQDLVAQLIGMDSGVKVSNIKYHGAKIASGIFWGGDDIIGFDEGIILTSGATANVIGPNENPGTTDDNTPTAGDSDLNAELGPNMVTMDASVLEFDFECGGLDKISMEYVWASEEYPEFVDSAFNDVFGFFLNGKDIADIPGMPGVPVAINTINCKDPESDVCKLFIDNEDKKINTEMDGVTVVLPIMAELKPGKNHIKIAVADVGDGMYDSAVFIKSGSMVCVAPTDTPSAGPTYAPTYKPTPYPTGRPTPAPAKPSKGVDGDPHITTWTGFKFDYQGACDLALVKNPSFGNGVGMDINIRTKLQGTEGSYIESVVVKIGKDVLEVKADYTKKDRQLWLNGVANFNGKLEGATLAGYPVTHKKESHKLLVRKRHVYTVEISKTEQIVIKQFKHLLNIHFNSTNKEEHFQGSLGLMGSFDSGNLVGRDGKTEYSDYDSFGEEWQVKATEPMLFHEVDGPQHPERCIYVDRIEQQEKRRELHDRKEGANPIKAVRHGRRLTQRVTEEQAEEACKIIANADDRKNCIFDVVSLNDLDMVGVYMDEDAETSVAH
mmetsp:Transcript_20390/g.29495  ORF Transcript_20390/g.29495 Transcript_20390/m.29495 type:complete len:616 (+) Transcript_20390:98-1945(+)|eukprot:CAMPEP_0202445050 /NCGR_PEP_ID=MMETSP1360-20130828/3940_1 /ASSEMBLY_ACC=CAM_ASM_000848 /TAXON_ID=515479 /ORGANISM="Licmophora paradoxa, Strain CCMP2313" /LENGTH=615 /DNA_ID=CAMNT_0049061187 /DNA_START=95 /DNA_END=1942 /DNA_ORIENTATION=-